VPNLPFTRNTKKSSWQVGRQLYYCWLMGLAWIFLTGCTILQELQESNLKRQQETRVRMKERYVTFEAPDDTGVNVSGDGLEIDSVHYKLSFGPDLHQHPDYDTPTERQQIGHGSLVFMESLYQFLYRIFGFEPKHKIHVILHDIYRGTKLMATTTIHAQNRMQNGQIIKVIQGIEMNFPLNMFGERPVRAHELAHAFTNIYLLPAWFSEGIAVWVEVEYAKGKDHRSVDLNEIKLTLDGLNAAQEWSGDLDAGADALTQWRYNYCYTIVAEIKDRFGEDFYPKFFKLMEEDKLYQRLPGNMPTSFLVYYLSQAAGEDLVPFFQSLKFKIQKLSRDEILKAIQQANQTLRRQKRNDESEE